MSNITNKSISEIILDNYHAIEVFKKYGIDYSTKAETALSIACIELGLDIDSIIDEINNVSFQITISKNFSSKPGN